jgi:murein DD-endopeptidase MepM/ murein hydrolase activator NlpD
MPLSGDLRSIRFDRDADNRVELSLAGDDIKEKVTKRETSTRTVVTSGEITSSLYAAARRAGLSPSAIATMTDDIFKYDIDFSKDLQPGDRFSVVMDETWREGETVDTSKILAATFTTGGKTYSGFRFDRNGKSEYYDINGRSLKKSFIRMPIPFARLSSTFGAASTRSSARCACTRAWTTPRAPARRSWPPAMPACSSPACSAATATW